MPRRIVLRAALLRDSLKRSDTDARKEGV